MSEAHAIVMEKVLPYAPEKIWRTLTRSELIARWLMPNDFESLVGHRFTFKTRPMGGWDGIVHCEVLQCDPPRLLRYSWKGGSDSNPNYGSRLNSELTWTLSKVEGGTHVRIVHDGFVFPGNRLAYDAMAPGWGRVMEAIARVTAETDVSTAGSKWAAQIRRIGRRACPVQAAGAPLSAAADTRRNCRGDWPVPAWGRSCTRVSPVLKAERNKRSSVGFQLYRPRAMGFMPRPSRFRRSGRRACPVRAEAAVSAAADTRWSYRSWPAPASGRSCPPVPPVLKAKRWIRPSVGFPVFDRP